MWDHSRRLAMIRRLTSTKLACSKTLVDLTTYNDTAMWWFVDLDFKIFLGALNRAPAERLGFPKFARSAIFSRIGIVLDILQTILTRLIVALCTRRRTSRAGVGSSKIIFRAQDIQWRVIRDDETGHLKRSDAFFDSVLKRLVTEYECLGVYPIAIRRPYRLLFREAFHSYRILIDKLRNWYVQHKPFQLYWSLETRCAETNAFRHFGKVWSILAQDETFLRICRTGAGEDAGRIRTRVQYYFLTRFPRIVGLIEMAGRMIDEEKPNLILVANEYGVFERALVVAAKRRGIPTLAVQHGVIHSEHKGYMYRKHEISPDGSAKSPYCPIPDKTAVYGPVHKHMLTKLSAYPEGSVVVTGQPRYDRLKHVERLYSRERFLRKYNIDLNDKIILWTTQCHALSADENRRNLRCVLEVVRDLTNVTLIIKQHPGEGMNHTRMIKDYLVKYKTNAVMTPGDSDTYEQLYACDLMISRTSTTVIEAVALDKPVIMLELVADASPIGLDYVKEGVAIKVCTEEELCPAIEKLLVDDSQLARNRKHFVEKYLYKLDGKATARLVNLISKMMRSPENHH
jgi:hypothetical protein